MRGAGPTPSARRAAGWLVPVILIALVVIGTEADRPGGDEGAAPDAIAGEAIEAPVTRVVDGDTIEVELDGERERVRYIGVDTPESVAQDRPVECFGKRAAELNRALVEGVSVRLVAGPEPRDHYGRLLAYVHADGVLVNAELLRLGAASTLSIPPNTQLQERFERLELEAARAGRGLWGRCR